MPIAITIVFTGCIALKKVSGAFPCKEQKKAACAIHRVIVLGSSYSLPSFWDNKYLLIKACVYPYIQYIYIYIYIYIIDK